MPGIMLSKGKLVRRGLVGFNGMKNYKGKSTVRLKRFMLRTIDFCYD